MKKFFILSLINLYNLGFIESESRYFINGEEIDDEAILADIAKNAKENMACEKATSKITDETILIDILFYGKLF